MYPIMDVGIFLKNPKQSLLDADHQVLNQRNLMKRFRKEFKNVDFGPKICSFTFFEHNKNFPHKVSSVIFMYLLNSNFMKKIRKK